MVTRRECHLSSPPPSNLRSTPTGRLRTSSFLTCFSPFTRCEIQGTANSPAPGFWVMGVQNKKERTLISSRGSLRRRAHSSPHLIQHLHQRHSKNTTNDSLPLRRRYCDPHTEHEQKLHHSLPPQTPGRARGLGDLSPTLTTSGKWHGNYGVPVPNSGRTSSSELIKESLIK
ncbi:hypothetical protein TNCV_1006751 [Trichonephila clavipes]|nr:hypothetical protein TNCV_1006751 [Trichonephila clavipes]